MTASDSAISLDLAAQNEAAERRNGTPQREHRAIRHLGEPPSSRR